MPELIVHLHLLYLEIYDSSKDVAAIICWLFMSILKIFWITSRIVEILGPDGEMLELMESSYFDRISFRYI